MRLLLAALLATAVMASSAVAMPIRDEAPPPPSPLERVNAAHVKAESLELRTESHSAAPADDAGTAWWGIGAGLAALGAIALTATGVHVRRRARHRPQMAIK